MSDKPPSDTSQNGETPNDPPRSLPDPGTGDSHKGAAEQGAPADRTQSRQVWMRGLFMLVFAVLFNIAQTVLVISALLQFFWILFAKERNTVLSDFGQGLGKWLNSVALFQSAATEEKPFPWKRWES